MDTAGPPSPHNGTVAEVGSFFCFVFCEKFFFGEKLFLWGVFFWWGVFFVGSFLFGEELTDNFQMHMIRVIKFRIKDRG